MFTKFFFETLTITRGTCFTDIFNLLSHGNFIFIFQEESHKHVGRANSHREVKGTIELNDMVIENKGRVSKNQVSEICLVAEEWCKRLYFTSSVLHLGPRVYPKGSYVHGPSVWPSLNISETALKLCMKLGVNKGKKVTRQEFWKKNL